MALPSVRGEVLAQDFGLRLHVYRRFPRGNSQPPMPEHTGEQKHTP